MNSASFHSSGLFRKECVRGQSLKSLIGFTSFGPPSPEAHTRTTLIPTRAVCWSVSGMRARSSSRYSTETLAPTKRNGRPTPTKRKSLLCRKPEPPRRRSERPGARKSHNRGNQPPDAAENERSDQDRHKVPGLICAHTCLKHY